MLHPRPHLCLFYRRIVRFGPVLSKNCVVERTILHAAPTRVRRSAKVAHGFEVPAHAGNAGLAHALQHLAPVADLLVHVLLGQGDLLPSGHEDIVQFHAVRLDLFPRLRQCVGAVLAGLYILCQRCICRAGTAPPPGYGRSPAQLQMDRVHADRAKEAQMLVVEFADGDLVLDIHPSLSF